MNTDNCNIEICEKCGKSFYPDIYALEYYGDTENLFCSSCLSVLESQAEQVCDDI